MKVYYVSDEYDTIGFAVVKCYGYKEYITALEQIKHVQIECALPQEINKESRFTLSFPVNDRNYFYEVVRPYFNNY